MYLEISEKFMRRTDSGLCIIIITISIIFIITLFFVSFFFFFTSALADGFPLESEVSSSLNKVFWLNLNSAVVWMVSICPLIFKSPSPCTNPLVTVPNAPIIIGFTVTFMFHSFSILKQGVGIYFSFQFASVLTFFFLFYYL